MKAIKKLLLLFLPLIIIMMMFLMFLGGGVRDGNETQKNNLSSSIEYYRPYVSKIAKLEGMEDYVDLILAVMQVESGGTGSDPMQASEGPFNKKISADTQWDQGSALLDPLRYQRAAGLPEKGEGQGCIR